jgi:hypothetical protein
MKLAGCDNRYKPMRAWCVNRGGIEPENIMRTKACANAYDQLEYGPFPVIIADARHYKVIRKPTPRAGKKRRGR